MRQLFVKNLALERLIGWSLIFHSLAANQTLPNREIWWAVLCKHRAPRGTVQRRYLCKPLSVSGRNALRQSKKGAWKLLAGCLPSCESWLVFVCLSFFLNDEFDRLLRSSVTWRLFGIDELVSWSFSHQILLTYRRRVLFLSDKSTHCEG